MNYTQTASKLPPPPFKPPIAQDSVRPNSQLDNHIAAVHDAIAAAERSFDTFARSLDELGFLTDDTPGALVTSEIGDSHPSRIIRRLIGITNSINSLTTRIDYEQTRLDVLK